MDTTGKFDSININDALDLLLRLRGERRTEREALRQTQAVALLPPAPDPLEQDRQNLDHQYEKLRRRASAEAQFLSDLTAMETSYAETYGKAKAASLMREVRSRLGMDPQESVDDDAWKETEEESDEPR